MSQFSKFICVLQGTWPHQTLHQKLVGQPRIQHLGSTSRQNHSKVLFAPREVSLGEGDLCVCLCVEEVSWGDKVTSHTLQRQKTHYGPIHKRQETEEWQVPNWAIMMPLLTMHPLLSAMTVMDQSKLSLVQRWLTLWHPPLSFSETRSAIPSKCAIKAIIEQSQSNGVTLSMSD